MWGVAGVHTPRAKRLPRLSFSSPPPLLPGASAQLFRLVARDPEATSCAPARVAVAPPPAPAAPAIPPPAPRQQARQVFKSALPAPAYAAYTALLAQKKAGTLDTRTFVVRVVELIRQLPPPTDLLHAALKSMVHPQYHGLVYG